MNTHLLQDLDAAFTAIARSNPGMHRRAICEQLSHTPAPRLYITPEYALRIIRYPQIHARRYRVRELHKELLNRWELLPPEERNLSGLNKIIFTPAPSFYLSPKYIYVLLYKQYDRRK